MRFLCLHGRGTSASIFESQTASFRSKLDDSYVFDFVDAPHSSPAAAGIATFYDGPYFTFYDGTDVADIRASHKWLSSYIEEHGPYDGVMMFSQGCAVVASFLLYHQNERPQDPLPFKVAIFICGSIPLTVIGDLGFNVTDEANYWSERSRKQLQSRAVIVAPAAKGEDRWGNAGSLGFDPSAPTYIPNVFGIDFTQIMDEKKIKIPTVHVFGGRDPLFPGSVQMAHFCNPANRKMFDHGGGHDIPRKTVVSDKIVELIRWARVAAAKTEGTLLK